MAVSDYGTGQALRQFLIAVDVAAYDQSAVRGQQLGKTPKGAADIRQIFKKVQVAAIATADLLGIKREDILEALMDFHGTDRRFEYKGTVDGVTIIDDYAHHPTEITATLQAAQNYPHRKLWCVFQPHTYSRTKTFMTEFAQALTLADHVVLTDIYAAREKDTLGISSRDLQAMVQRLGGQCDYFSSFEEAENFLLKNCINGDLLITMGAGDVHKIGESLMKK